MSTWKSDTYPDDYSENVSYTDGDGNEREIHFQNGEPHVHYEPTAAREGETSWEATGHHDPDELDNYVLTLASQHEKGELEDEVVVDDDDDN